MKFNFTKKIKNDLIRLFSLLTLSSVFVSSLSFPSLAASNAASWEVRSILGKYYPSAVASGIIANNVSAFSKIPTVSSNNAGIKSLQALGDDILIVTLDSRFDSFNFNDLQLRSYNEDWYSLNADTYTDRITVKNRVQTINSDGCTVLIYQINEKIKGSRLDYKPVNSLPTGSTLDTLKKQADNCITWQMDNGGWDKGGDKIFAAPWDGKETKNKFSGWSTSDGQPIATIDNNATHTQMRKLALAYRATGDTKYRDSFLKGMDFLFKLQYPTGGFAQVYPRRGNYSDFVTYNDAAMISVMMLLDDVINKSYPFDCDIITPEYEQPVKKSFDKGIEYIYKSQIENAAWGQQHNPTTYKPEMARNYEPASLCTSESVGIVKFLIAQNTPESAASAETAMNWFKNVELKDTAYKNNAADGKYFYYHEGSRIWCRFYEIGTNRGIFGDRDKSIHYDISEISEERRLGYSWAGSYCAKLLDVYDKYGFYANKIDIYVKSTNSKSTENKTLLKGSYTLAAESNLTDSLPYANNYGDIDFDGYVTAKDASLVLNYTADSVNHPLTEEQKKNAVILPNDEITAETSINILEKTLYDNQ